MRRAVRSCAVAVLVLVACGGPADDAKTLNLSLKTAPNRLDPALVVDVGEGEICALLFEGLVRLSPEGTIVPALARDWQVGGGGVRYTFHLDASRRFADGTRVRAADVVRSFERVLAPGSASSRQWVLDRIRGAAAYAGGESEHVDGLEATDDSTLTVTLASPFAPFISLLAMPAAMVVGTGSDPDTGVPVGAGRWRLAQWERGDYLALEPNRFHPEASRTLASIRFRIIPEAFTRIAEFESGALDVLEVPTAEVARFRDDGRYQGRILSRAELRVYYIGLNNTRAPFTDRRVRRALNMAIDVDRLIEVLAAGEAEHARGAIPPTLPGYRDRPAYPYDPAASRALLAEAGLPDGFAMEIWQRESPEGNRVLEAVQGYLAAVGIQVTLVRREWSAFKEAVAAGRVDAFFLDWFGDYPDAENFLFPLFHSENHGGGGNRAFFSSPEVDALIEQASRTEDAEARAGLYARTDSLVYAEAPWIYLYFPRTFHVVADGVSGFRLPTLYLGSDYRAVSKTP